MQVRCTEGLASHSDPESCAGIREGVSEALTDKCYRNAGSHASNRGLAACGGLVTAEKLLCCEQPVRTYSNNADDIDRAKNDLVVEL